MAHQTTTGAERRLLDLLPRSIGLHRCVITCRTQFFPETSRHLTTKDGHFVIGEYECPLLYLSLFDECQVRKYLDRHFGVGLRAGVRNLAMHGSWVDPARRDAEEAALAMEKLRMRPLLLSYIQDFLPDLSGTAVDFRNRYAIYARLVDRWLMRDAGKPLGLPSAEGWRIAALLAIHMLRTGCRKIPGDKLTTVPGIEAIPQFQIGSRSLMNRTSDGEFQFAHETIQDFLLAWTLLNWQPAFRTDGVLLSLEAWRFLEGGRKLVGDLTVELRGARFCLGPALRAVQWLAEVSRIELILITPGRFRRRSGNAPVGRRRDKERRSTMDRNVQNLKGRTQRSISSDGLMRTAGARPTRSAGRCPTTGVCTTCTGTCGSGAWIMAVGWTGREV